ncbi:alpha/beta hydrolase [Streptomyces sp. NPDC001787]|uniref:alpha/beta hydrolase n=1 Tax=Streptomyces sp. NPDC001787 TaxID=3154523 RepID=UPI003318ED5A
MTAFVLVAGSHTGGWVWREVAAGLRESGAGVHPATLTGLGDRRHLGGPDTDLETHIEDLVRLVDHVDEPEVVLVGHGYGIHPVLGAADRRPERVARIVYLDVGLAQNGDAALELVPDPSVRERLRGGPQAPGEPPTASTAPTGSVGSTGSAGPLPPPAPGEWTRWGSTAGLTADALARLDRLAAPQPVRTLTQPLRLSGAVSELPMSGVLCTANGSSIALVERMVGLGAPQFQALVDPEVSFFELDTGHWPMLSAPDELTGVLLAAAEGRGHRIAPEVGEQPAHLRPFLLDVPERRRERVGRVDLYPPDADGPRPAVVLVHGGPVPAGGLPTPRDWPGLVGYASYAADLGAVGVTLDHRLHGLGDFARAAQDVADAVALVRSDPRVDGQRIALWFCSVGGLLSADWLAAPPPWLRCVALTSPALAPLPNWGAVEPRFRPADTVGGAGRLPVVLTRVGLESPEIAVTVQEFLDSAGKAEAAVEVIDIPHARHGFETIDHTDEARRAVERAMASVLAHLRS